LGIVPVNEKEALWELIKAQYVFPSEYEERGKRATILTIGRALRRFKHALNKFYVQPGVSPFNRFGFITPNEWNTFKELHTTPESMARSNRMKELIRKNKFKHRLGSSRYKVAIPLWTKKEQEHHEAGIPDPLEGCTLHMRNWIRGRSRIDDKGQLVTSNSDITRVIENAKDLITKEKTGKFKPQ
jgi:antitoxin component HigA of HigAB toxin-antitoxin module